jgi:hypothetical protein
MGHSDVIVYTKENDFITKLLPYSFANLENIARNIVKRWFPGCNSMVIPIPHPAQR